jgi:hypothetical protein
VGPRIGLLPYGEKKSFAFGGIRTPDGPPCGLVPADSVTRLLDEMIACEGC